MASWLESLEELGSSVTDSVSDGLSSGLADRIKSELNPDSPANPADQPEKQYDTTSREPIDGPEQTEGPALALQSTINQYKWWIAGGLGIVAYMAIKGAR